MTEQCCKQIAFDWIIGYSLMTSVNDISYFIVSLNEDYQYSDLLAEPRDTLQIWVTYGWGGGYSAKKLCSIVIRWNRLDKLAVRNSSRDLRWMLCSCPSLVVVFSGEMSFFYVYCVGEIVTIASA